MQSENNKFFLDWSEKRKWIVKMWGKYKKKREVKMHHIFSLVCHYRQQFYYEENFSLTTISFLYCIFIYIYKYSITWSLKLLVVFLRG